jgi:hypothetical protein
MSYVSFFTRNFKPVSHEWQALFETRQLLLYKVYTFMPSDTLKIKICVRRDTGLWLSNAREILFSSGAENTASDSRLVRVMRTIDWGLTDSTRAMLHTALQQTELIHSKLNFS